MVEEAVEWPTIALRPLSIKGLNPFRGRMKGVPMGGSFSPDGRQKVTTMVKGSRRHSGKICAATTVLLIPVA